MNFINKQKRLFAATLEVTRLLKNLFKFRHTRKNCRYLMKMIINILRQQSRHCRFSRARRPPKNQRAKTPRPDHPRQRAIIAQQLIPTPDGKGRRACLEVLLNSPLASDLIRKGEVSDLKELMKKSTEIGMQTFDQALFELYDRGEITYEDALSHADSPNDLRLMIKLASETDAEYLGHAADELSLESDDSDRSKLF